jgi:AI-2 transport protein TqsA
MVKSPPMVGNSAAVNVAAFVVIVAGLRAAQAIVVPFLLAAFLTLLSLPMLLWFQKKGLPTWMALMVITAIVILIGLVLVGAVGSSVNELRLQLPAYQERVADIQEDLIDWLKARGIEARAGLDEQIFDTGRVLSLFGNMLGALGALLNNALIIVFMLIFMQLEAADLPGKLRTLAPDSDISARLERIQISVWRYFRLKTRISFLTGILVTVWLWLLGVDFPLLWGLLAFLFNFVPTIGSFIAAVPALLVAVLQPEISGQAASVTDSLFLAAYTVLGYLVINVVIGNVIEPRVMGSGAGLSTLVVFLSLVFWGWVFGPVGMVLSVPLTMVVKIVLDNSQGLQWVAILLGSDVPVESSTDP